MGTSRVGLRDVSHGRPQSRLRLLAPLRYLVIQSAEKRRYDLVFPALSTAVLLLAYYLISPKVPIFGDSGLLKYARDTLVMAVPFMVGALAAVSMGAPGPYLDRRFAGAELVLDGRVLTARQFVCYLLGYLCFVGLATLGMTILAQLLHDPVLAWTAHSTSARDVAMSGGLFVLFALLSTLTFTTFWSLYFLADVVNRPVHQQEDVITRYADDAGDQAE